MPLSTSRKAQITLLLLTILLLGGFLATSLVSYYVSRDSIRDNIVNTELPLTSDNIYSEIQKDLIRPTQIASMMSRDTFLRDWALNGEQDIGPMTRYLREIQDHYGTFTSFFISERTRTYYQAKGVLKQVKEDEPRDAWYFRVRGMAEPYEISVDPDMANSDRLTFFINFKVFDYQEQFIGVAGVGLTVDAVVKLVDDYQRRYDRTIYFTDRNGRLVLTSAGGGPLGLQRGQVLGDLPALQPLLAVLPKPDSGRYEYVEGGHRHFLNVRYIPELDWFLFVDKIEDGALSDIRQGLYLNLLICALVSLLVIVLVYLATRRYQKRIAALATTDVLTGLPNRRGFDLLATQALHESVRERSPLSALLIDLDHFKLLNDTHGHLAGDQVLRGFARSLQGNLRQSDIICRWGGEEFILLLKDTGTTTARLLAEKIRQQTEEELFPFNGVDLQVTTSIGVTELQGDESLERLIARADRALYRAKQSGRNRVCEDTGGLQQ
ncbi:sensor domain-containing diguanylate cyclase [Pseudomonas sp. Gutcm_11s]|uniref:sensor domain-containing diguanylate cyclase n=1 Tax=Pseudomonas sp. Gutcm_11s TaxID=3026088 RepID=UPI0023617F01|nr:sensor domain-containing diguanylate cyclase [Pseudomonas sp. Gutcm_11s]MDD0842039.1 sensor domain-containing diguanylate cyclase [Pseudomonas sp. Gutcm_11s]